MVFENGADSFFHKGTNGRWRDVLTPAQLDRYDTLVVGRPAARRCAVARIRLARHRHEALRDAFDP